MRCYSEGFGPDAADQINRFLDSSQESLLIERNRFESFLPLIVLGGIGLPLLLLALLAFFLGLRRLYQALKESAGG